MVCGEKLRTSSFELDEEMIGLLFGYTMQSSKNEERKCKTSSQGNIFLKLKDFKTLPNASADQICSSLEKAKPRSARIGLLWTLSAYKPFFCLRGRVFLQQPEALVKMVLTKEEELKLCSYKEVVDELGSAEKFLKALVLVLSNTL